MVTVNMNQFSPICRVFEEEGWCAKSILNFREWVSENRSSLSVEAESSTVEMDLKSPQQSSFVQY
jgi:hypothetical protein